VTREAGGDAEDRGRGDAGNHGRGDAGNHGRSDAEDRGRGDGEHPGVVPTADPAGLERVRPAGSLAPADAALTVAFVCVQNAGRSQMATAFAERERAARGLEADVALVTGGTRPAERVHEGVVEAMAEIGVDLADREPREVTVEELRAADYVVTMGCDAGDVCPASWGGESRDWGLDDPDGADPRVVGEVRDEIVRRVRTLFDEAAEALADRDESPEVV